MNRERGILILGAGGHAKVIADILICQGQTVLGFLDDNPNTWGQTRLGLPIFGAIDTYASHSPGGLLIGIGDNKARAQIAAKLGSQADSIWVAASHPRATIAGSVRVGRGAVIAAGAVINPDAVLGGHTIVNTGATVDHDCAIGDYAHVAPGAHISGGVRIGAGALVGVGATIVPGCAIGDWAIIGAGAVVVRDVPAGVVAKGVPARW